MTSYKKNSLKAIGYLKKIAVDHQLYEFAAQLRDIQKQLNDYASYTFELDQLSNEDVIEAISLLEKINISNSILKSVKRELKLKLIIE